MQYDHLGVDHASVLRNRLNLADRSRPSISIRNTEVSLIRRAIIERFHCNVNCQPCYAITSATIYVATVQLASLQGAYLWSTYCLEFDPTLHSSMVTLLNWLLRILY